MKNRNIEYIPLIVTVGQVVIFPYYTIWLKEVSFSYTLFAWLFAVFSFSAAWGYRMQQTRKEKGSHAMKWVYMGMGFIYLLLGIYSFSIEWLPYMALVSQIILGFLQGYFRSWNESRNSYRIHVTSQYILVGTLMLGLSFMKVVSPGLFLAIFGACLLASGTWEMAGQRLNSARQEKKGES
ncbi:hypothetical protein [Bacillus sp. 1P06AnD]|uniref:hypothetical protein n=1 Tax=Bacillus sp. 1P06AnD TaxID=3132208 RepID=UPI0039A16441